MSLAIPDAWTIETGTWGTDLDLATGNADTNSGGISLKFLPTTVATSVLSEIMPVEEGLLYSVSVLLKASRANVGDTITIQYNGFDADKSPIAAGGVIFNAVATNPGNFEYVGKIIASSTFLRFLQVRLSKAATDFTVFFDRVVLERIAPHSSVLNSATGLIADGATRNMVFNSVVNASGFPLASAMLTPTPASGLITVNAPGMYQLEMRVVAEDFNNGDDLAIQFSPSLGVGLGDNFAWQSSQDVVANDSDSITIKSATTIYLNIVPQTITMNYRANSAGSPVFRAGGINCYMLMRRLFYP